ncbi:MAG: carbohydrate kinase family protein [Candidatus Nomurabacteria bacterium]|jgi:sugar/nucleoside kinase (ribokinase family)|nr:carbohydrate kinase family protein [Candidatus Nomurabacteria bacterium]
MPVRVVCVGAVYQEAYLSHSPIFKPVHEGMRGDFTEIKLGDTVEVERVDLKVGGTALNAAVTFARQSFEVGFAGTIGHDTAGQMVVDLLDRECIDRGLVAYSRKWHTGFATVLLSPKGERTLLLHPGAAGDYSGLNVPKIIEKNPNWIYITSLKGDFVKLRELLEECVKAKIKIALKPGLAELKQLSKLRPLLEDVDLLLVSARDAKSIVGGETLDELVHHCLNLVPSVAITAGVDGSIVSDSKTVVRAGLYEDVHVIDKTGAGDAFDSGLLAALLAGKPLAEAVVFASANAVSVAQHIGAQAGILNLSTKLHPMLIKETKLR